MRTWPQRILPLDRLGDLFDRELAIYPRCQRGCSCAGRSRRPALESGVASRTNLKWAGAEAGLRLISCLENPRLLPLRVMHRNTFLEAPHCLEPSFAVPAGVPPAAPQVRFTATEGYAQRWRRLAGCTNAARLAQGQEPPAKLPPTT